MKRSCVMVAVLVAVMFCAVCFASTNELRMAFFCTEDSLEKAGPFWGPFIEMMSAAADDLGVELDVYFARDNHVFMKSQVQAAVESDEKPDGIIVLNFKGMGEHFIELADEAHVPVVLVNTALEPDSSIGRPREKYACWIAEILPDDVQAGRVLAETLIAQAPRKGKDGRVHLLALEGHASHASSQSRIRGMNSALETNENVVLEQVVNCSWNGETAKEKTVYLVSNRYPEVSVIWSASDEIAMGAASGLEKYGWNHGRDFVTGGIDWSQEGKQAVLQEQLTATVGGHFMEGAWAVILLYDHLMGVDLPEGGRSVKSPMMVMSKENVEEISRYMLNLNFWKNVDFGRFSRYRDPSITKYIFRDNYIEHLKNIESTQ